VLANVEIEAYPIAVMTSKMEAGQKESAPTWTNVKTFAYHAQPFAGRVDYLLGGYPCQPFSTAGKGLAKEDPRHLWPYITEIIRVIAPKRILFENVEGHINRGLEEVLDDLRVLGYKTEWNIFSASEVGAPHGRKRMFILGEYVGGHIEESTDNWVTIVKNKRQSFKERLNAANHINGPIGGWQGWPARPNEPQHSWEPPRTVPTKDDQNRVDRLRLLGNGVVPQCAQRAIEVLDKALNLSLSGHSFSERPAPAPEPAFEEPTAPASVPVITEELVITLKDIQPGSMFEYCPETFHGLDDYLGKFVKTSEERRGCFVKIVSTSNGTQRFESQCAPVLKV
jgi:hypothetical protein